MPRFFAVSLILLFLSGCANQALKESNIDIAIEENDIGALTAYKANPYLTGKGEVSALADFSNAMESAIYKRNIEAVRFLISTNSANKVSVHYYQFNPSIQSFNWARTPTTIPAAELACGVGAFDIMALLLQHYPQDIPNYTNCLHYYIASFNYYPSFEDARIPSPFFRVKSPNLRAWRTDENTAIAAQKIIDLGANPNNMPNYARSMYHMVVAHPTNHLLTTLLKAGMDPNKPYECGIAGFTCSFLTDVAINHTNIASDNTKQLINHGAKVNALYPTPVITAVNDYGTAFQREQQNITALHMARFYEQDKMAETLIELGADSSVQTEDGKTADDYAGSFALLRTTQEQRLSAYQQTLNQQQAATANTNQDSDGIGASTLFGIISGAVGIMDVQ